MLQVRFAFFAVVFETVSALRDSLFNFKGCCWWDNFCKQNLFYRRWSHGRNFRCFTQITCGESRHEIWEVSNRHLKDITDNPTPYFVLHNVSKAFLVVNNKILVPCSFKLKRLNNNITITKKGQYPDSTFIEKPHYPETITSDRKRTRRSYILKIVVIVHDTLSIW